MCVMYAAAEVLSQHPSGEEHVTAIVSDSDRDKISTEHVVTRLHVGLPAQI